MITKEQKDLIQDVKRESGTNEFLSVSDLIVRIEQNYKEKGEDIYYEDVGITFSNWNDFLRNTPLSMDLFIGEGAIFEGFEEKESSGFDYPVSKSHHATDKMKLFVHSDYRDEKVIVVSVRRAHIIDHLKGIRNLKTLLEALDREAFRGDFLFLK